MKLNLFFCFFGILGFFPGSSVRGQSVGINATGSPADSSAIIDLSSQQKGLLIPRLSTAERNAIYHPARALLIYNLTSNRFEVNTGSSQQPVWEGIVTLEALQSQNLFWKDGGNAISGEISMLGSTNAKSISLISNNTLRLYIDSTSGRIGINTQHPKASLHIASSDALILPVGNTAQRPVSPVVGMIRYNAETGKLEGYTTGGWKSLQ